MKKTIPFIALFVYIVSFAPKHKCPIDKAYVYTQSVSQGKSPHGQVEEGKSESKSLPGTGKSNYLFYLLLHQKAVISPVVLWIRGQGFEVKMDAITKLPVRIPDTDASGKQVEIQLVPSTSKKVIMLTPGSQLNFFAPPPARLQKLLDTNELVIEYRWNEETCYFPISTIKKLKAVAAE